MDTNLKLFSDETLELVNMTHYRNMIGSLMYLTNIRPDICFAMNTFSLYLVNPICVHLIAAKDDEVSKRYDRLGTLLW